MWHSRPSPPFMAKAILNFHFDYLKPSLSSTQLNMSEFEKLVFPQFLYTVKQLKIFGFIDKYHFFFNSTYLTVTCGGQLSQFLFAVSRYGN